MYLYGLIRNPKYKELMIKKAGTDKDAFETPWMKKVWNEYYTSTITSPAAMAKPMQQPGLMTNKSMSQKNNQTTTQVIKQEGSINWPHREKRKRRKKEQRRKSSRNTNTATKSTVGNAGLSTLSAHGAQRRESKGQLHRTTQLTNVEEILQKI